MAKKKVIIMGAAGRDFHNFNVFFRKNSNYEVICFTATQISGIDKRKYPKELAGSLYPNGIPIYPEKELEKLIKKYKIDEVFLSYSDIPNQYVMERAALVLASGAQFSLLGPEQTQLKSKRKIISIGAVRTGCGKSATTRYVCDILRKLNKKFVVIRHPMPYGDLRKQIWQRFETYADLKKNKCTIEEREEYEPHINRGEVVYAGVDYAEILKHAEKEAEVIVWDGGNNDFPFYKSDLHIVLVDPHRPGHELKYYPGTTNLMLADIAVISKENTALKKNIEEVRNNIKLLNPQAKIIDAELVITSEVKSGLKGKRVLAVEDGPTLTHGSMAYGAAAIYAKQKGAKLVDPRPYGVGSLKAIFKKYPQITSILPAMGYSPKQIKELEATINKTKADYVAIGTPINLSKLVKINKPAFKINYEFNELGRKIESEIKKLVR